VRPQLILDALQRGGQLLIEGVLGRKASSREDNSHMWAAAYPSVKHAQGARRSQK
jgi:hypothetical protein